MRTDFLRIGKSSLSAVLSIVMVLSAVLAGSFSTAEAVITDTELSALEVGADAALTDAETADFDNSIIEDKYVNNADSPSTGRKAEKKLPESSGDSVTVYFANTPGWDNVIIADWVDGDNFTSGQHSGLLWTFNIDSSHLSENKFLFCNDDNWNNDEQTVDMSKNTSSYYNSTQPLFVPGYYSNNDKKSIKGSWVAPTTEILNLLKTDDNSVTVYFKNTLNWSDVYAYTLAISDNNTEIKYQGLWPGTKMTCEKTDTDENKIYSVTIHSNSQKIFFHNNDGTEIKVDISTDSVSGKMYNPKTGKWEAYEETDPEPDPETDEPDADWYIGGRFSANGKSTLDDETTYGWSLDYTKFKFDYVSDGKYKYETNQTIAELSELMYLPEKKRNENKYFIFRKVGSDGSSEKYGNTNTKAYQLKQENSYNPITQKQTFALGKYGTSNQFFFNDPNNTSIGKVTLWIDTADDTNSFYFTVDEPVTITHGLYSDVQSNYINTDQYHNGTGIPQVSVKILDGSGNSLLTRTGENGKVLITKTELQTENAATLEITLSSAGGSDEIVNVYEDTGIAFNSIGSGSEAVKTYDISDILQDGVIIKNKLNYYTDYKTDVLNINFKYYNRSSSSANQVETIDETPTTAAIKGSFILNKDSSIENAIANALNFENGGVMNNLNNIIDEYYFWTSEYEAVNGIKELDNYHEKNGTGYKKYKDSGYTDSQLAHHMDSFGNPLTNPSDSDYWVTYTLTDGTTKVYKSTKDDTSEPDYYLVKSITVWGYNAPKLYTLEMYMPENENSVLENFTGNIYYSATKNTSVPCQGFFNQRLGGEDTTENNTAANSNSTTAYLAKYGITNEKSYLGKYTPPAENVTSGGKTYKFDGWYAWDKNTGTKVKVSTDRYYQNRITANLNLVAGYAEAPSQGVGLSVTNNGIDTFYDSSGVKRISLNTQVNVYGADDTDKNITKIAAVYLQLPVKDSQGKIISWTQTMVDSLGLSDYTTEGTMGCNIYNYVQNLPADKSADVRSGGTVTFTLSNVNISDYKVISYNYNTSWEDTSDSSAAVLTNKNRLQFALPMKAEYYEGGSNSAIIAYAAINYSGKGWILSDNCVPYIYNLADVNPSAPEDEVTGIELTAP